MKLSKELVRYIEDNCYADELTGGLKCIKCHSLVTIDWFEQEIECQGCDEL